jgi:hypothetical protein
MSDEIDLVHMHKCIAINIERYKESSEKECTIKKYYVGQLIIFSEYRCLNR